MTKSYRVIDSRTSKLVEVRTAVVNKNVQVVFRHLEQTHSKRTDFDHDEDAQVDHSVPSLPVDVEKKESY